MAMGYNLLSKDFQREDTIDCSITNIFSDGLFGVENLT